MGAWSKETPQSNQAQETTAGFGGLPLNLGGSPPHPNIPWDPLGISPVKATYKGVEGGSDTQLVREGTPACLPFLLLYLQWLLS